jgi:hypothetical protein
MLYVDNPAPQTNRVSPVEQRGWDSMLRVLGIILLVISGCALLYGLGLNIYARSMISSSQAKLKQLDSEERAIRKRADDYNNEMNRRLNEKVRQQGGLVSIPRNYFVLPQDEPAMKQIQDEYPKMQQRIDSGVETKQKAKGPTSYGAWGVGLAVILLFVARYAPHEPTSGSDKIRHPGVQYCSNCGANVNLDDRFCPNCGAKIV